MAEVHDLEVEASEIDVVEQKDAEIKQAAQKQVDDDIPPEFKGMSASELAKIAQHARREMGRQGNELGEIRKLADELIKSQLRPKQPESEPVPEVDFFENPQEAIRKAVESNPRVLAAEGYAIQAQKAQRQQQLMQVHPDFVNIVRDPDFGKWVMSSGIRKELFQRAEAYDLGAAHELLSTFKQLKPQARPEVSKEEQVSRSRSMNAAAVDTGGSGESGKKVYRRADLIRLKMRDPTKYEDMSDEILKAYNEGRVR